ncbi:aspartokinase [Bacteroidia bacterium]|nr:aspartokinase [Bacteroidia bacterium]
MKVLKFGGTSVGSAERMRALPQLIVDGTPKIVVLSAMSGTTNALVEITILARQGKTVDALAKIDLLAKKYDEVIAQLFDNQQNRNTAKEKIEPIFALLRELVQGVPTLVQERTILAQGELMSTMLQHLYLLEIGVNAVLLPALDFMRKDITDEPDIYFIGEILKRDLARYSDCQLFITQGYICRNHKGEIDNLKRGGSDYTASIIGAAIGAEEVQIWTDIDGFHNNDPRVVQNTHSIPKLSFDEASELAYFGAKILHPTCVLPVQEAGIPLIIKNTMNPKAEGTRISNETDNDGTIKAVAAKDNITAVKIKSGRMLLAYGFLRKIFDVFEEYHTAIDMVSTSEVAVSLTIDDDKHLQDIERVLQNFGTVEIDRNMTIVSVVGYKISESNGIAGRVFNTIQNIPIRMISFGGSRHNIGFLVKHEDKKATLEALNNLFKK